MPLTKGPMTAVRLEHDVVDFVDPQVQEAIWKHVAFRRFTPIDPNGYALSSLGWCVAERPYDIEFEKEQVQTAIGYTIGMRYDEYRFPKELVSKLVEELAREHYGDEYEERKQRKKLNKELMDAWKTRVQMKLKQEKDVLPKTKVVNAIISLVDGVTYLLSHSDKDIERFGQLFSSTFVKAVPSLGSKKEYLSAEDTNVAPIMESLRTARDKYSDDVNQRFRELMEAQAKDENEEAGDE